MNIETYIFLTDQGTTYQPSVDETEEEIIENLQVIGLSSGIDANDAFQNLLIENEFLQDTSFNNVFSYPLSKDFEKNIGYHNIKKLVES
jgi:hypothetical protein